LVPDVLGISFDAGRFFADADTRLIAVCKFNASCFEGALQSLDRRLFCVPAVFDSFGFGPYRLAADPINKSTPLQ
jgi:hypothetical protein